MPKSFRLAEAAVNAQADAVAPLLDGGYLRIYDGTQPASADEAPLADSVLLAELRFAAPAFGPAEGGVIRAEPLEPGPALSSGTATWFRALAADGLTAVFDGSVGTEPDDTVLGGRTRAQEGDLLMPTTSIVRRTIIEASALTFTARK